MTYEIRTTAPGCLLLVCQGEASWEDRQTLTHAVERELSTDAHPLGVVLDFTAVGFVNSAGLGALFQLVQHLRGRQAGLAIVRAAPPIVRLFEAVGFHRVARLAPDLESAVAGLQASASASEPASEKP